MNKREQLFNWILYNVVKHPEGVVLTKPLIAVRILLFPIRTLCYWHGNKEGWQWMSNTYKLRGQEFSAQFFDSFSGDFPERVFRVYKDKSGIVTIEKLEHWLPPDPVIR